jgi:hypothetical protein
MVTMALKAAIVQLLTQRAAQLAMVKFRSGTPLHEIDIDWCAKEASHEVATWLRQAADIMDKHGTVV